MNRMWPGLAVVPDMATGASDGVYTNAAGMPTYCVSGEAIDRDDIRAHGKDERIRVDVVLSGGGFLLSVPESSDLPVNCRICFLCALCGQLCVLCGQKLQTAKDAKEGAKIAEPPPALRLEFLPAYAAQRNNARTQVIVDALWLMGQASDPS